MVSTLTAPESHNVSNFIGKNYEIVLKQSVEALLTSLESSNSRNSTNFTSELQKFVQSKADPPLESIWIYAALTFTRPRTPKAEPFSRISAIKDLFQFIVSCSASCNSLKSIALVAPVIYYLRSFILDVKGFQLGSKIESKVTAEIKSLVDSIISYISVCCNGFDGNFVELEGLIMPLGDLISFWLVDNGTQNKNVESRGFFPLLSNDIVKRVSAEGCGMIDLAGFVVAEAFSLKLCWKIREEGFGEKTQDELRSWIVGSITGLRSSYFYVTFVSTLLEPVLPIASLVNLEHEAGLRKVLFDALILVEYSFLRPQSLGWMLNIENRGIKIFDDDMSEFRAAFNSKEFANGEEGKKPDSNLLFYIDNNGQEDYENEEDEKMSAAFMAAAHSMRSSGQGGRKRKTKDGEKRKKVKFVEYNAFDNSALSGERSEDHPDSGSDIENPSSDEDMEIRE